MNADRIPVDFPVIRNQDQTWSSTGVRGRGWWGSGGNATDESIPEKTEGKNYEKRKILNNRGNSKFEFPPIVVYDNPNMTWKFRAHES